VALSAGVTFVTALLAYPVAFWLVRLPVRYRPWAFAVILIPILTNVVVRGLGVILLLAPGGLVNGIVKAVGLPPFTQMLFNHGAVALALAQVFLPFIVIALYDTVQNVSPRIHEAAESLGASPAARFLAVDLPLSLPGLRAGITIVFLMTSTSYVSAAMLGGRKVWTTGMLVYQEALQNLNAPLAAALALIMTVIGIAFAVAIAAIFRRLTPWQSGRVAAPLEVPGPLLRLAELLGPLLARLLLALALTLLLLPLVLVCVQSFNDVPQATVAGFRAFTLKWYEAVFTGGSYTGAFWNSVRVAAASTVVSLVLALPAAFALARAPFLGLTAIAAFWMLPLSLPHVIIGVGMLRLLQAFNTLPPFFGLMAVHVVLILPFAITLLAAAVAALDKTLEEAAASLGGDPVRRFFLVVLPGLGPGLVTAAIMAFLLSFEEVTVTNFLTTARLQTLPVKIYGESSFSLEPTVHAVSALLIVLTMGALVTMARFVRLDRLYGRG
jgi:putative spermidine/putrescine transport system permease protein